MKYNQKNFGLELKSKILKECNVQEIANSAFKIYADPSLEYEASLDPILLKLVAIEEGSEFVLTKREIIMIAEELINEKHSKK